MLLGRPDPNFQSRLGANDTSRGVYLTSKSHEQEHHQQARVCRWRLLYNDDLCVQ